MLGWMEGYRGRQVDELDGRTERYANILKRLDRLLDECKSRMGCHLIGQWSFHV